MNDVGKSSNEKVKRLFIKVTHDTLPQIKDKHPFIYLERGRLEIDDSSVKWIDSECNIVRLPIATINTVLLGPGTSVTHESIKVMAAATCSICLQRVPMRRSLALHPCESGN